jgi:AcrR family transcriptional regulator
MPSRGAEDSKPTARPTRLSRDVILDAAQTIGDHEGAAAITMRRVGAELGVDPTAIYRHFRSKDELLVAMADRLFAEVIEREHTGTWRERLSALLIDGRAVYGAHPSFVEAMIDQPDDTPHLQRISERVFGALREAGLSNEDAALFYDVCVRYVAGTSLLEAIWQRADVETSVVATRRAYAALPPDEFPNCVAVAPHLYRDSDDVFKVGLEMLLDAIEARGARAAAAKDEGTERG